VLVWNPCAGASPQSSLYWYIEGRNWLAPGDTVGLTFAAMVLGCMGRVVAGNIVGPGDTDEAGEIE
jgi:hypothetical protein